MISGVHFGNDVRFRHYLRCQPGHLDGRRLGFRGGRPKRVFGLAGETAPGTVARRELAPERTLAPLPRGGADGEFPSALVSEFLEYTTEYSGYRGDLFGIRVATDNADVRCRLRVSRRLGAARYGAHSGMFPCFLGGRLARLVLRARSALMTTTLVAAGSMIPSSSPRSAARNGLATL